MIVLDTNVLSALMRAEPDAAVIAWLDRQTVEAIWTTAVTVLEVEYGLAIIPDGRRKRRLQKLFAQVLDEDLGGRVLPFDRPAALAAAELAAIRRSEGKPVDVHDTQIGGIVLSRRMTLATRNTRHFDGVPVVDPWQG